MSRSRLLANWGVRAAAVAITVLALAAPAGAFWWSGRDAPKVARQVHLAAVDPASEYVDDLVAVRFSGSIPVLTYHNIEDVPSRYAVKPEAFNEQMALLAEAGFHTVSSAQFVAFLEGRPVTLPPKPVLITFDDGPKTAWIYADPILERYRFRAVMFTITGRVGQHQPYYLTWDEIERMHRNGRWDFESHTKYGHRRIKVNEHGALRAFLTNKMWQPSRRNVETIDQYERRVSHDLDASTADLEAHGLPRPRMFAFPFSASSFPANDARIPRLLKQFVSSRFAAVMDNVDEPVFVRPDLRGVYLPRIEVFNDTTLRRFVESIRSAGVRTAALPEAGTSALAKGKESIYSLVNQGTMKRANLLLENTWALPRSKPATLPWPLSWTEDPFGEPYWRFLFYSLRPTSDLLWAYYQTGDVRYRDKLLAILESYVDYDRTRPVDGTRFDDAHASAFRAMVLVNCYWKLDRSGDLPPSLAAQLRNSIARLGAFLANPDHFDEGHNHGFNEAAALLLVAETFPGFDGAGSWRHAARTRLQELITHVVDADGVEIENSPFYHFYVLTFASEIAEWADRYGVGLPAEFRSRVRKMLRYATLIVQPDGTVPLLGASVRLDVRALRPDLYGGLGKIDPEFQFVRRGGVSGVEPTARLALFPQSGTAILRSGFGSPETFADETHVVFDVGPWRTAHSHLDALAVTYYSSGRALLPDSGLFRYEEGGAEHRYFWSTRAHNTVVVDGRSQDTGTAHAGLTRKGTAGWLYQSGFHRLYRGVEHDRSVLLLRRDLALVVDRLAGGESHRYVQTWHVFPGARVTTTGLSLLASGGGGRPALAIHQAQGLQPIELRTISGGEQPLQGWYSDEYGKRVANTVAEYGVAGRDASFATLLASGPYAALPASLSAQQIPSGIKVLVHVGTQRWTIVIARQARSDESVSVRAERP